MSGIKIRTVIRTTWTIVEIITVENFLVFICPPDSIKESSNIQPPFSKLPETLPRLRYKRRWRLKLRLVTVTGSQLISAAHPSVNRPLVLFPSHQIHASPALCVSLRALRFRRLRHCRLRHCRSHWRRRLWRHRTADIRVHQHQRRSDRDRRIRSDNDSNHHRKRKMIDDLRHRK